MELEFGSGNLMLHILGLMTKTFYGTFRQTNDSAYYGAWATFTENYDSGIIMISNLTLNNGTVVQFPVSPSKNQCWLYLKGYTYQ